MEAHDPTGMATETQPATVVGVERDALVNTRVRKSFGSRAFWGTIVGCYWVSGGLFYKVSFDDGDVDIFSADETVRDAQQAGKCSKEDPQHQKNGESAQSGSYYSEMRQHSLKRKRDEPVDTHVESVFQVKLWGQRLYATIYTNERNETFVRNLVKTDDGQEGELEASKQVRPGDLILAVNDTRVLGMNSLKVSELIRKTKRPIVIALYRHPQRQQEPNSEREPQVQTSQTQAQSTQPPPPPAHLAPPRQVPVFNHALMQQQRQAPVGTSTAPTVPMMGRFPGMHQGLQHQSQAYQRTQPTLQSMDLSATQRLMNQMLVQERMRQMGYVSGHQPSGFIPPANMGLTSSAGYSVAPNPYAQTFANANAAAMTGLNASATYPVMTSMIQPQMTTRQVPLSNGGTQWRRTGVQRNERVQVQSRVSGVPVVTPARVSEPVPSSQPAAHSPPNVSPEPHEIQDSRFTVISHNDLEERRESPRIKKEHLTSAQHSLQPTDESRTQTSSSRTESASGTDKSPVDVDVDADAAAIAALAEENPKAARSAMAAQNSDVMSFLSPHEFSESNVPSSRNESTANSMDTAQQVVANNMGTNCILVQVSRPRLYLTLGSQGSFIAVTSFVSDENGMPGEIEASGKVFVGDVLLAINGIRVRHNSAPIDVAHMVNAAPRPMTLAFERASWDILEGRE